MKHFFLAINWILGALLLTSGVGFLFPAPLAGISLILIALLLFPPARKLIYSKTGKELTTKARAAMICVLVVSFSFFVVQASQRDFEQKIAQETKARAELAEAERQKETDFFNANAAQILAEATASLDGGDFKKTIAIASKYSAANSAELTALKNSANEKLAAAEKSEKTEKLLASLKNTQASDNVRNRALYQQLADLHPENKDYRDKEKTYSANIAKDIEDQRVAAERKKEIELQFSAWDGSHIGLERFIKDSMDDPDSYKHVETRYWDRGDHLVVMTTFRGKNAFGGVVKSAIKAKVDLGGKVLQIIEHL